MTDYARSVRMYLDPGHVWVRVHLIDHKSDEMSEEVQQEINAITQDCADRIAIVGIRHAVETGRTVHGEFSTRLFMRYADIRMNAFPRAVRPDSGVSWQPGQRHWLCCFRRTEADDDSKPRLNIFFTNALDAGDTPPDPAVVLDVLANEASLVDNDFEDFSGTQRQASLMSEQTERLRKFLGADLYEMLLYSVNTIHE